MSGRRVSVARLGVVRCVWGVARGQRLPKEYFEQPDVYLIFSGCTDASAAAL